MNRGADPLAIRTQWGRQPYSYVSRTQRSTLREFIHGRIQDDLPKMNRLWFWMRFVVMGVCSVYALKLAVIG